MSPLTPARRDNMIAWMAARADAPHYGELLVYRLPKERLVLGPMQLEAMINQDTTISRQISLWDQHGSRVLRGNLLVIPIGDSFIYVEPVYLSAEGNDLPQLKRIIVSDGDRLAMEPTLEEALRAAFGGAAREGERHGAPVSRGRPGPGPPNPGRRRGRPAGRRLAAVRCRHAGAQGPAWPGSGGRAVKGRPGPLCGHLTYGRQETPSRAGKDRPGQAKKSHAGTILTAEHVGGRLERKPSALSEMRWQRSGVSWSAFLRTDEPRTAVAPGAAEPHACRGGAR